MTDLTETIGIELRAEALPLLEKVRCRAKELKMPLESAIEQALLMYLHDHPSEGASS